MKGWINRGQFLLRHCTEWVLFVQFRVVDGGRIGINKKGAYYYGIRDEGELWTGKMEDAIWI